MARVISERAKLRDTPSAEGEIKQEVAEGAVVKVLDEQLTWYVVRVGDRVGWMHGNALKFVGGDAPPSEPRTKDFMAAHGTAMLPAIRDGQRLNVKRFEPDAGIEVTRGDVVAFWFPNDPSRTYFARLVGMPGETVEIREGAVYINGRKLDEPYVDASLNRSSSSEPPVYVKPHYYYVLGDNRDNSSDSRMWGLVPEKYIYARVILR